MSPAGSEESLSAAIRAGADAVYFGVGRLNMRAHAANCFRVEDMQRIAGLCSRCGVKPYLTVNTVIFDGDMDEMQAVILAARDAGVQAIIASDVAAMVFARQIGMEVHLSVQMSVTNVAALQFFAQFADVVVLARELTLDQVKNICDMILERDIRGPGGELVRVELFCHGALCMSVSGKCWLSLHSFNASANRGECFQPCRRSYAVKDKDSGEELDVENGFIMSPKDLKTVHFLDRVIASGVSVLKIEGRARGADYVKTVTECYRQAADACIDGSFGIERVEEWNSRLESVFNRGFWNGYYLGQRLGEWTGKYGNSASSRKVYIGRIVKYFPRAGVAEFVIETGELKSGDQVLITGPTTGALEFTASGIRVDDLTVDKAVKGNRFSMLTPEKVRPSDRLFRLMHNVEQ
jgi:putative protease